MLSTSLSLSIVSRSRCESIYSRASVVYGFGYRDGRVFHHGLPPELAYHPPRRSLRLTEYVGAQIVAGHFSEGCFFNGAAQLCGHRPCSVCQLKDELR
jgi:hypothetical protein